MDYILTEEMFEELKKELDSLEEKENAVLRAKWNSSYFNAIDLNRIEGNILGIEYALRVITGKRRG